MAKQLIINIDITYMSRSWSSHRAIERENFFRSFVQIIEWIERLSFPHGLHLPGVGGRAVH